MPGPGKSGADGAAEAAALHATLGPLLQRWRGLVWPEGARPDERPAAGVRCIARVAAAVAERSPEAVASAAQEVRNSYLACASCIRGSLCWFCASTPLLWAGGQWSRVEGLRQFKPLRPCKTSRRARS